MRDPVHWEKVSPDCWTSTVGYVNKVEKVWTAHVYRNVNCGRGWTEKKPGFLTVASAKRWVEQNAEE